MIENNYKKIDIEKSCISLKKPYESESDARKAIILSCKPLLKTKTNLFKKIKFKLSERNRICG